MNEHQLQASIVMEYSQLYPEKRGTLFAANNEAANDRHAMALKALGVYSGVSDLILLNSCIMTGIELKIPGAKHKRAKIERQYEWGKTIVENGGRYYIAIDRDSFFSIINGAINENVFTLDKIKRLLEQSGSVIMFDYNFK